MVAARVLKEIGAGVGDEVRMRFRVADQDAVDVPAELAAALRADAGARAAWEALTPGRRRGLAHRVQGAKARETRARRVAEILAMLAAPRLDGPAS